MVPIELARLHHDPVEVAHTGGADSIEADTDDADPTAELAEDNPIETLGDLIETDTAPIEDTPAVLVDTAAPMEIAPTPSMSLRRALAGLGRNR